ncbi:unnamed protein product [Linum tenue]|uniref:Uncharacterized protein n=1 Tax=Linum tenue TaxID=586396 RepID=A0AAV0NJ93_9ROSI|nr:unnamed protein product [Linum tenue]
MFEAGLSDRASSECKIELAVTRLRGSSRGASTKPRLRSVVCYSLYLYYYWFLCHSSLWFSLVCSS